MMRPTYTRLLYALCGPLLLGAAACSAKSLVIEKPADVGGNQAVTELWAADIARVAQSGDWILSRSYSFTGDVISVANTGERFSHASIYDGERGTVIEAIMPVVREVPLEHLLDRNHYVVIVRPQGLSQAERLTSVVRARQHVGAKFDVAGLAGVGSEDRFYCSELVVWASGLDGAAGRVVTPSELMDHGEVIYYSGQRDDRALMATAVERRRRWQATRAAAIVRAGQ